jgi:opacity protein-like surface antigen
MKNCLPYWKRLIVSVVSVVFVVCVCPAFSQENGTGIWTSIEIKKKLDQGFAVSLEEEYRTVGLFRTTDQFMSSVDVSWKPLPFLKGGVAYTLINKYDATETDPWELKHRVSAYLTGSVEWNRWEFSLREKWQTTRRVGVSQTVNRANPSHVLRSKCSAAYNIKGCPLTPYVGMECFLSLNDPDGVSNPPSAVRLAEKRMEIGCDYKLVKNLYLSLGYLYASATDWDKFFQDYIPASESVVTGGVRYSF